MKFNVKITGEFEDQEAFELWKELKELDKKEILPHYLQKLFKQLEATVTYVQHVNVVL